MEEQDLRDPRKRGLGRGLSALFGDEEGDAAPIALDSLPEAVSGPGRRTLGVDQLEPGPFQPRQFFNDDALAQLAESIAVHGVLQPLLVREKPGVPGRYEIIAGERRWRASQRAQLHQVPVVVLELDDAAALEIALIENLQREDLNALEEAQGYRRLMDEFGHTQEKLAAVLGKSRSHIANMVRLLNLPEGVQAMVRDGKLTGGHARALVTAADPMALAREVIEKGLNVRETEKLSQSADSRKPSPAKAKTAAAPKKDVDTLALEQEVSNLLGMRVSIDVQGAGSGVLQVSFRSLDQLDEVLHRLSHNPGRLALSG